MSSGEVVTKLTASLASLGYVVTLCLLLARHRIAGAVVIARICWTAGCVAMCLHVAAAFHFYHAWSHALAVEHTAAETAAVVGWNWGGGVWFNYLVLVLWLGDVCWWWTDPAGHQRRRNWITIALQSYLAFIFFNAIVVFESGYLRIAGLAATAVLLAIWWTCRTKPVG